MASVAVPRSGAACRSRRWLPTVAVLFAAITLAGGEATTELAEAKKEATTETTKQPPIEDEPKEGDKILMQEITEELLVTSLKAQTFRLKGDACPADDTGACNADLCPVDDTGACLASGKELLEAVTWTTSGTDKLRKGRLGKYYLRDTPITDSTTFAYGGTALIAGVGFALGVLQFWNARRQMKQAAGGGAADAPVEAGYSWQFATLLGICGTVGSGVFLIPGELVKDAGSLATYSWIIAGLVCIMNMCGYSILAPIWRDPSSILTYGEMVWGKDAAVVGWASLTFAYLLSSAGLCRIISTNLQTLHPEIGTKAETVGNTFDFKAGESSSVDVGAALFVVLSCGLLVMSKMGNKLQDALEVIMMGLGLTKTVGVIALLAFALAFVMGKGDNSWEQGMEEKTKAALATGGITVGLPQLIVCTSKAVFGYVGFEEACAVNIKKSQKHMQVTALWVTLCAAIFFSTTSSILTTKLAGTHFWYFEEVINKTSAVTGTDVTNWNTEIVWKKDDPHYTKLFGVFEKTLFFTGMDAGALFKVLYTFLGFSVALASLFPQGELNRKMIRMMPSLNLCEKFGGDKDEVVHELVAGVMCLGIAAFVDFSVLWNIITVGVFIGFNVGQVMVIKYVAGHCDGALSNAWRINPDYIAPRAWNDDKHRPTVASGPLGVIVPRTLKAALVAVFFATTAAGAILSQGIVCTMFWKLDQDNEVEYCPALSRKGDVLLYGGVVAKGDVLLYGGVVAVVALLGYTAFVLHAYWDTIKSGARRMAQRVAKGEGGSGDKFAAAVPVLPVISMVLNAFFMFSLSNVWRDFAITMSTMGLLVVLQGKFGADSTKAKLKDGVIVELAVKDSCVYANRADGKSVLLAPEGRDFATFVNGLVDRIAIEADKNAEDEKWVIPLNLNEDADWNELEFETQDDMTNFFGEICKHAAPHASTAAPADGVEMPSKTFPSPSFELLAPILHRQ